MAQITNKRLGELIQALFRILEKQPEGMKAREALSTLADSVTLTEYEAGAYESGRRFEKIVRFATVDTVRAGWLIKDNGVWMLTEEGLKALKTYKDPLGLYQEASRLYRLWRKHHKGVPPSAPFPCFTIGQNLPKAQHLLGFSVFMASQAVRENRVMAPWSTVLLPCLAPCAKMQSRTWQQKPPHGANIPKIILNSLTDLTVEQAKPKAREYSLVDGSGLFLVVTPGGGKLWRLRARLGDSRINRYPTVSLAEARLRRDEVMRLRERGINPREAKEQDAQKAALSVTTMQVGIDCANLFFEHARPAEADHPQGIGPFQPPIIRGGSAE